MSKLDAKSAAPLIQTLSKKLNVPAETLKREFEEGKFDSALNNMGKAESAKFNMVVKNPKLMEKFISTPQAQALYKKLTGGK